MTSRDTSRPSRNHRPSEPTATTPPSLADAARIITADQCLSAGRQRDILSAFNRTAQLLGQELRAIPVDLRCIKAGLSARLPLSAGISPKTLANIRSNLLAGIKVSGLCAVEQSRGIILSAKWRALENELRTKRHRFGLSRLARHCAGKKVEPADVDDAILTQFIEALHQGSLRQGVYKLHRNVALIWNEVAQYSKVPLQQVAVPSFRHPTQRVDWLTLPPSFQKDAGAYLEWSGGIDPFAADARSRALAPLTVHLQRNHIHSAVTALIDSGVRLKSIKSLANSCHHRQLHPHSTPA